MTSTDSSVVLFPAFMYGDLTTCRRKMKAEAKKWAKRYRERGDFPEPKLAPVPPGSILHCTDGPASVMELGLFPADEPGWYNHTPNTGKVPRWHVHLLSMFPVEIIGDATSDRAERPRFDAMFESFACKYPWGALSLAVDHALFNTIEVVSKRVEAVLFFWEQLEQFRYIHASFKPRSFRELMAFHFEGHIAMWVDHPTGDVRQDVRLAIDQMRRASADEVRGRLLKRLYQLIDIKQGLQHRDRLKQPGMMENLVSWWAESGPQWYDDLTTGHNGTLGGALIQFERHTYPND